MGSTLVSPKWAQTTCFRKHGLQQLCAKNVSARRMQTRLKCYNLNLRMASLVGWLAACQECRPAHPPLEFNGSCARTQRRKGCCALDQATRSWSGDNASPTPDYLCVNTRGGVDPLVEKDSFLRGSPIFSQKVAKLKDPPLNTRGLQTNRFFVDADAQWPWEKKKGALFGLVDFKWGPFPRRKNKKGNKEATHWATGGRPRHSTSLPVAPAAPWSSQLLSSTWQEPC